MEHVIHCISRILDDVRYATVYSDDNNKCDRYSRILNAHHSNQQTKPIKNPTLPSPLNYARPSYTTHTTTTRGDYFLFI